VFDYKTGQVDTSGSIHNPEYYEYMRRTRGEVPRQPGDYRDIPYTRFDPRDIIMTYGIYIPSDAIYTMFCQMPEIIRRNKYNTIEIYRNATLGPHMDAHVLDELRMKFIKKEISDDKYRHGLYTTFRTVEIMREATAIMENFTHRMELFYYGSGLTDTIKQLCRQIDGIDPVSNEEFNTKAVIAIADSIEEFRNNARPIALESNRRMYELLQMSGDRYLRLPFITGKMFLIASKFREKETLKLDAPTYKTLYDMCATKPRLFDLIDDNVIDDIQKSPSSIRSILDKLQETGTTWPRRLVEIQRPPRAGEDIDRALAMYEPFAAGAGAGAGAARPQVPFLVPRFTVRARIEELEEDQLDVEENGRLQDEVIADILRADADAADAAAAR
jgi:hypothetical protein